MKRSLLLLIFLPFFCLNSCSSVSPIREKPDAEQRIAASEKRREERRFETERYSLREKAEIFENRLNDFIYWPYLLIPRYKTKEGRGPIHMEHASFMLSYLTSRYVVTKEENIQRTAKLALESIIAMDECNGLDGFLPLEAEMTIDGKLKASNEDTHANVYAQLMFAYIQAYYAFPDPEIKKLIAEHTASIAQHLVKYNYQLVNQRGEKMKYSNIKVSRFQLNWGSALGVMLLTTAPLKFIDRKKYKKLYQELKKQESLLKKYNYPDKGPIFLKIANLEFPTSGSSYLNFLALHALFKLTHEKYYSETTSKLHSKYDHSANVFFDIIYLDTAENISYARRREVETRIFYYLKSYPLTRNSAEMVNSHRKDIKLRKITRYIKLLGEPETMVPLPIYERPATTYEWIRNQHRLDGGEGKNEYVFNGIDYLQAYWMFKRYQKEQNR